MKRFLLLLIVIAFSFNAKSQTNFGLFLGGGVSIPKVSYFGYDTTNFALKIIKENDTIDGIGYKSAYAKRINHIGMSFENVLVERMFYLDFGLHLMNRGYRKSDDYYISAYGVHIPLTFKYKYFFNRRSKNYVSVDMGFFGSAYFYGIEYDKEKFSNPNTAKDYNLRIKFGKIMLDEEAEMAPFDYGSAGGIGVGLFGHLKINYNFGYSWTIYKIETVGEKIPESPFGYNNLFYRNTFHSLTVGYYFSNK